MDPTPYRNPPNASDYNSKKFSSHNKRIDKLEQKNEADDYSEH